MLQIVVHISARIKPQVIAALMPWAQIICFDNCVIIYLIKRGLPVNKTAFLNQEGRFV
jgi:hypothetical protein